MISEKLGVPDSLEKEADRLYKIIHRSIKKFDLPEIEEEGNYNFQIGETYIDIEDTRIDEFSIILNLIYDKEIDGIYAPTVGVDNTMKTGLKNGLIEIKIDINNSMLNIMVVGDKLDKKSIIKILRERLKPHIIAHELKHLYDNYYKPNDSIKNKAEYDANQINRSWFPPPITMMFHLLYFTSTTENLVRPTEMYKKLKEENITKSKFKEFMDNSEIIKTIDECINFSFNNIKKELYEIEPTIKKLIDNIDGYESQGNYIDEFLNMIFINYGNLMMDRVVDMSKMYVREKVGPLASIFGLMPFDKVDKETEEVIKRTVNKSIEEIRKYSDNHIKFFENIEKKLNFVGRKMKKKLYKLYDMVPEDTNSKILNWDLHTKIQSKRNGVYENIDFKLKKFDQFKLNFPK
jgi:hypothetical protein